MRIMLASQRCRHRFFHECLPGGSHQSRPTAESVWLLFFQPQGPVLPPHFPSPSLWPCLPCHTTASHLHQHEACDRTCSHPRGR